MPTPATNSDHRTPPAAGAWSRLAPWLAAGACALAALTLGALVLALRSENSALRTEAELAAISAQLARTQLDERTLLAERLVNELRSRLHAADDLRSLKVTTLRPQLANVPDASAVIVWQPARQTGLLVVEHFPAIARELDYQVWFAPSPTAPPVSAGLFKPDSTGRASVVLQSAQPPTEAAVVTVSLENQGGAPAPDGPVLLRGRF